MIKKTKEIIVLCPNCEQSILILKKKIGCSIFRHGVYKKNNKPIDPHTKEEDCNKMINENLIYGCGKPFRLINDKNEYKAIICDYI